MRDTKIGRGTYRSRQLEAVPLGRNASARITGDGDLYLLDSEKRVVYLTASQARQLFATFQVRGQPILVRRD